MTTSNIITLSVQTPSKQYPIYLGCDLLSGDLLRQHIQGSHAAIISNTTVAPLYLSTLKVALAQAGIQTIDIILPDGEQFKNWESLNLIFDGLLSARSERKTPLIALGGGVIGDMTGFAAAAYLRGVPFIQIPTTLLSQVDSSVGGKTGINHPLGKNMIGAFNQPEAVLIDVNTLTTLPDREFSAGLAEVIKYGLIGDKAFFEWLEQAMPALIARDPQMIIEAVERSCRNKAQVVAADEKETGVRAHLNLGHTFGHAIEAGMGYGVWLHGEAVAAGTMQAVKLSARMGWLTDADVARIEQLFVAAKLPTEAPELGVEAYMRLMAQDKKVEAGKIRFVLLKAIGQACISSDIPEADLHAVLA